MVNLDTWQKNTTMNWLLSRKIVQNRHEGSLSMHTRDCLCARGIIMRPNEYENCEVTKLCFCSKSHVRIGMIKFSIWYHRTPQHKRVRWVNVPIPATYLQNKATEPFIKLCRFHGEKISWIIVRILLFSVIGPLLPDIYHTFSIFLCGSRNSCLSQIQDI